MGCEGNFRRCIDLRLRPATALVFLFLRDETACQEDLCLVISREELADRLGLTEKAARLHLDALRKVQLITVQTKKGRGQAMRISLPDRSLKGQQNGHKKGQQESLKIELNVIDQGQQKGQQKGQSGVSGVGVVVPAVGTAVSLSVGDSFKQQPAAKPAAVAVEKRAEDRDEKAPGWSKLCQHITETWTVKKKRAPGWPKESWVNLWTQAKRFRTTEIAALWDEYLCSTDEWIVKQSHPLTWFCCRMIDGIADRIPYKQRGEKYGELWLGEKPASKLPGSNGFQPVAAIAAQMVESSAAKIIPRRPAITKPVEPVADDPREHEAWMAEVETAKRLFGPMYYRNPKYAEWKKRRDAAQVTMAHALTGAAAAVGSSRRPF